MAQNGPTQLSDRVRHAGQRHPDTFSFDEGADVGIDQDTPVTEAYQAGASSRSTGTIDTVTVQVR
jgi:hypothetical protein